MIVDAHTHILDFGHWPQEWWQWVADDWASKEPGREPGMVRDRIERGLVDPDGSRMIERMDRAGVDASIVLPIDWGPDYTTDVPITAVVDATLRLAIAHPGRLIPFAGIDPRRENAAGLVERWLEEGARGLKLYPGCGWDPLAPEALRVYEVCERRGIPVLFHTGHPLPLLDADASRPIHLRGVVERFPGLRVWLGHAGAPDSWSEALEVAAAGPLVRLELSVWLWDDNAEDADIDLARRVLEAGGEVGFDRLMFGTDHVSGCRVRSDGFLTRVVEGFRGLPENAKRLGREIAPDVFESIMSGTVLRDLGFSGEAFRKAHH